MLICIKEILTPDEITKIKEIAKKTPFVDGKETAGGRAIRVKNNRQASQQAPERQIIQRMIQEAMMRNQEFCALLLPKRIRPPLISRYEKSMAYGLHTDDALMGPLDARVRSDISATIFISEMSEYEGGELLIHHASGYQPVKLPAGYGVFYPSHTLHEVAEVKSGERLVGVTWIESYIREDHKREILGDMLRVRDRLHQIAPDMPETDLAYRAHSNLLRLWAET